MLLSFSVAEMRPYVEAGLRERAGEALPPETRVKRQTVRVRGPNWQRVIAEADEEGRVGRDLHLWWKSRTKDRALLGVVRGFHIFPVSFEHRTYRGDAYCNMALERGSTVSAEIGGPVSALPTPSQLIANTFARADGFDALEDFVPFFVPKPGDRFVGALIKW